MDPSLLVTKNLHEVKHWVEPRLIPYGWGMFEGLTSGGWCRHDLIVMYCCFPDELSTRPPPRILIISPSELHSLVDKSKRTI